MGDTNFNNKEIYTYDAPWTTYALSWCRRPDDVGRFRLAVGSFIEEYTNEVAIIHLQQDAMGASSFKTVAKLSHPYPATKIMWSPPKHSLLSSGSTKDLLATTGDYLRLWTVNDADNNATNCRATLKNDQQPDYCAPLTSFDWNETDPTLLGTCSIDTSVTIWDLHKQAPKAMLIAHDREVFDIAFAPAGSDIFATSSADGSMRMFDLRSLQHSTILYENPAVSSISNSPGGKNETSPILRVSWNNQNPNYVAGIFADSSKTIIVDIRVSSVPLMELVGHQGNVNGVSWAPHSAHHIATCGDDHQALIWDVSNGVGASNRHPVTTNVVENPVLAYSSPKGEINNMQWCSSHEDWISIAFDKNVQILRV